MMGAGAEAIAAQVLMEDLRPRGSGPSGTVGLSGRDWNSDFRHGNSRKMSLSKRNSKTSPASSILIRSSTGKEIRQDGNKNSRAVARSCSGWSRSGRHHRRLHRRGPQSVSWWWWRRDDAYTLQNPGYRAAQYVAYQCFRAHGPSRLRSRTLPETVAARYGTSAGRSGKSTFVSRRPSFWTRWKAFIGSRSREQRAGAEIGSAGLCSTAKRAIFPGVRLFDGQIASSSPAPRPGQGRLKRQIEEQSTYFRLHTWVTIGTTRFALYSLLERKGVGVVLIYRTFGTE